MIYVFGAYELDMQLYELRRSGEPCRLEPQAFDVLAYLVRHRDRLVSKDELFENIWPGRVVTESALTSRLKTARQAIGDSGRNQRFIKTIHGRGYRFIGDVDERAKADNRPMPELATPEASAPAGYPLVGRDNELAVLRERFARALAGERQLVFIEGEAGLGKTSLIHVFLDEVRTQKRARIGIGQCFEPGGTGEAYMPVLDSLAGLCRDSGTEETVACLADKAPAWLVQMPWLVGAVAFEQLQRRVIGASRERMLREFVAASDALCVSSPLILVFEDLHWSDPSTVGLLSWLARRNEPIRLLVLCSYRPGDVNENNRALVGMVQNLRIRALALVIALSFLDPTAVPPFLKNRFPGCPFPEDITARLHHRTGGNPLFMRSVVDAWADKGALVESEGGWRFNSDLSELFTEIPETLRVLIEGQFNQLADYDQGALQAASVAGIQFSSALAAAGATLDCEQCEERLTTLAEKGLFIVNQGLSDWPDGTVASQFGFRHAAYREVLYSNLPAGKRVRLHGEIGRRLEQGYGRRASERAVELAAHFTEGREFSKALDYRLSAAMQALRRSGYGEAIEHLQQGLAILREVPDLDGCDSRELSFQMALAPALIQTNGWTDIEAERALRRARELAEALEDNRLPSALYSLAGMHELRGEYGQSQALLEQQLALPNPFHSPLAQLESYELMACSTYHQGAFTDALEHADKGLAVYEPLTLDTALALYGENPGVSCNDWAGLALWFLGYPEQALARIDTALELSRDPARRYSLSTALCQAAALHQYRGEPEQVLAYAEEAVVVATEQGFVYPRAVGQILKGWALAVTGRHREGFGVINEGLAGHKATGAHMDRPYYMGLLADAWRHAGDVDKAKETVDEALAQVRDTRRFFNEAELQRLKAQLLTIGPAADWDQAESLLRNSVETARRQESKMLELRATKELVQVLDRKGEQPEARVELKRLYESFTEGFDTPDLHEVRQMLADAHSI